MSSFVIFCPPPSPSDDGVTYEQPLRCFSFLSYFQGVCFGYQAREIFCVQIGRIMPLKDGKCILSEHFLSHKNQLRVLFLESNILDVRRHIYFSRQVTVGLNLHVFTQQAEGPALFLMRSKLKCRRQCNDSKKGSSRPYQLNTHQFRRWCRDGEGYVDARWTMMNPVTRRINQCQSRLFTNTPPSPLPVLYLSGGREEENFSYS